LGILIPPFGGSNPPAPASQSGFKDSLLGRAKMPVIGGLLEALMFSQLTKSDRLTEIIPKISAHMRHYSRFRENLVGEISSMSLHEG
jgi:hypothetical protein